MGVLLQATQIYHCRKTMFASLLPRASTARVLSSTATRAFFSTSATSAASNIPAGFAKIKEKQKYFNIDNGKRVHQRGGTKDEMLYNLTLLVVLVGLAEWARVVYTLAFPQK